MKYVLFIEYDGTEYAGWQIQKGRRTIQGEIERNLNIILKESVKIIGAGRTDSGVHAREQVANFTCSSISDLSAIQRSLNGLLEKDIRIKRILEINNDFHARFSAKLREYHYQIALYPTAIQRDYCWYVPYKLNFEKMQKATDKIVGTHNFKSFCRIISEGSNYYCTIEEAFWLREKQFLLFIIKANRFLHGMVRSLVGTIVDIGRNKLKVSDMKKILLKCDRSSAGNSAPAKGLVLERIYYNAKFDLGEIN
jgi:tRNA pseudouridine38-40 synthase